MNLVIPIIAFANVVNLIMLVYLCFLLYFSQNVVSILNLIDRIFYGTAELHPAEADLSWLNVCVVEIIK